MRRHLHEPPGLPLRGLVLLAAGWAAGWTAGCAPGNAGAGSGIPFEETGATPAYTLRGRWDTGVPLTWHVDSTGAPAGCDLRASLERAFDAWAAAGPVTFEQAPSAESAQVRISFQSGAHGACRPFGIDTSVAHTGPVAPGTFVHFDADRDWEVAHSLDQAALHEIGHLLGLDHNERPASLMFTDPEPGARIDEPERAALATLYAGDMSPDGSDLWVRTAGGEERVLLWRAVPANTGFAVLDADADGRDDVLVWRTDEAGQGALTLYLFDAGMRPTRTVGPLWGSVVPGAPTSFVRLPSGERLLRCALDGRRPLTRAFDATGRLGGRVPQDASGGEPAGATGDLDGDGRMEEVFRR